MLAFFELLYGNFAIGKIVAQIVLFKMNKSLELGIYNSVWLFCLTINLGIKSGKTFLVNFEEVI